MNAAILFWMILIWPVACGLVALRLRRPVRILQLLRWGIFGEAGIAFLLVRPVLGDPSASVSWGWFMLDALSGYHLGVMMLIFGASSLFAGDYFDEEIGQGALPLRLARRLGGLWFGSTSAMVLVLVSNNLGIMWVGIEATTLMTAFLICIHVMPASLEAMWKYLLMCSVGVACAFLGTLLVAAAARSTSLLPSEIMMWTRLRDAAAVLDPRLMKLAFVFLLVGYGTKVGLAPLHNWLPDAHSQAPAPVSAIFSGFMLNAALYCIMRYLPLLETMEGGAGWSLQLLRFFGAFSMVVAMAFILFQHDLKRLLAYHSVEHMGIITLGLGIGGLGSAAALFHVLNHALCKTLAFFCAGRLGQAHGTHHMESIRGSLRGSPVWGIGLLGSLLALIGVAPFALFMSELQIVFAAIERHAWWSLFFFLAASSVIFIGALQHAVAMAWGEPPKETPPARAGRAGVFLTAGILGLLLLLGLWMPSSFWNLLTQAAHIVEGRP